MSKRKRNERQAAAAKLVDGPFSYKQKLAREKNPYSKNQATVCLAAFLSQIFGPQQISSLSDKIRLHSRFEMISDETRLDRFGHIPCHFFVVAARGAS